MSPPNALSSVGFHSTHYSLRSSHCFDFQEDLKLFSLCNQVTTDDCWVRPIYNIISSVEYNDRSVILFFLIFSLFTEKGSAI